MSRFREPSYLATVVLWAVCALAAAYLCVVAGWRSLEDHRAQITAPWRDWGGPILHVLAWLVLAFWLLTVTYLLFHHLSWNRRGRGLGTSDQPYIARPTIYDVLAIAAALYLPHGTISKVLAALALAAYAFLCAHALPALYLVRLVHSRMHRAVAERDVAGLERLLQAGGDPHFRDFQGRTPLALATYLQERGEPLDAGLPEVLRHATASPRGGRAVTALDGGIAPRQAALSALPPRTVPEEGEDRLACFDMPLHEAILRGAWHWMPISGGMLSDPDEVDNYGWTPLHEAVFVRSLAFTESLVKDGVGDREERGAALNARTNSGWTPLHLACYFGYGDMAAVLLRFGADQSARDDQGRTPADIARARGYVRLARLLPRRWARLSSLPWWSPMDFCEDGVPADEEIGARSRVLP